ncbi:MAG: iron-sulfur cluster assembly scaffold protein, partial [Candidatus Eisenbacteria bacterium]
MSDLRDLYQEVVLDHGRHPRNFHPMESPDRQSVGFNPLCGDKLTLYLRYRDDILEDISF